MAGSTSVSSTRSALLAELKRRGPSTARELAPALGVGATAVRQHLARLAGQGLVSGTPLRRGPGRPAQQWQLSAAAERLFPDAHAALSADLGAALVSTLRRSDVARVLRSLESTQVRRYRARVSTGGGLGGRLRALVRVRNAEGYMSEVRQRGAGVFELVQNHCPVVRAAEALPGLCDQERRVLRRVLGAHSVVLAEGREQGARRCVLLVAQHALPKNHSRRRAGRQGRPRRNS